MGLEGPHPALAHDVIMLLHFTGPYARVFGTTYAGVFLRIFVEHDVSSTSRGFCISPMLGWDLVLCQTLCFSQIIRFLYDFFISGSHAQLAAEKGKVLKIGSGSA